jgi:hypothetical protein
MTAIEAAQRKIEAANFRILAAGQRQNAEAHRRQATHPIYPGQEMICAGKADMIDGFAARSEAQAELLDAQILAGREFNEN